MGIVALITEFLKLLNLGLPRFFAYCDARTAKIERQEKRETDAIKAQVDAELKAQENQSKKEAANQTAFLLVIDESWKIRYEQILSALNAENPSDVLVMSSQVDNEAINLILFNSEEMNEYKARKIVGVMRHI